MQRIVGRTYNLKPSASILWRRMSTTPTEQTANATMLEGYKQWKAMGVGGTSHTWAGYMSNLGAEKTLAFGADETLDLSFYKNPEKYAVGWKKATQAQKENAFKPFLSGPLPQRQGARARAKPFVFPQRERKAANYQDPDVKEAYIKAFNQLGDNNKGSTEWKISALEKHGQALFTRPQIPDTPLVGPAQREICHIHETDLSGHVTLSFADAEEIIAKGWGERHRLSGTDWIHLGYTMLYVPNSVIEVETMVRIYQAGVDYMCSGG